jgi:GH15 family glucan-1,4-alpha-glucosidase
VTQKPDISDFALIGNGRTAALVRRSGAIEWLCWPRFDSDACFAALLGDERHGHWTITPAEPFKSTRKYRDETLVLETQFTTEHGRARLVDFMPVGAADGALIRMLVCEDGHMAVRHCFNPVFGNGKRAPQWSREQGQAIARAGVDEVRLWCSREEYLGPDARIELSADDRITFELGRRPVKDSAELDRTLQQCEAYWRDWSGQCGYQGRWRDTVIRSLITLKALIHQPTGGMVAAPTTSLPEKLGGSRNWDYRFCWLRDSTMTVLALLHAGYRDEAGAWVRWMLDAIKPEQAAAQPVYGLLGNPDLLEYEAEWLPGFGGARPVRFGNAACRQFQLDIYGEVLDTIYQWHSLAGSEIESSWIKLGQMMARLETAWRKPDAGFWEQRSDPEFFTQSRAQAWVAFDRAVKSAERFRFDGPVDTWRALRTEVHDEVCKKGFSPILWVRDVRRRNAADPDHGFPADPRSAHYRHAGRHQQTSHAGRLRLPLRQLRERRRHPGGGRRVPAVLLLVCRLPEPAGTQRRGRGIVRKVSEGRQRSRPVRRGIRRFVGDDAGQFPASADASGPGQHGLQSRRFRSGEHAQQFRPAAGVTPI